MSDFGQLGLPANQCAGACGRPVDYGFDVCARCVAQARVASDWPERMRLWGRVETVARALLYTNPERLAALVAAFESEVEGAR